MPARPPPMLLLPRMEEVGVEQVEEAGGPSFIMMAAALTSSASLKILIYVESAPH